MGFSFLPEKQNRLHRLRFRSVETAIGSRVNVFSGSSFAWLKLKPLPMSSTVSDNHAQHRFELQLEGGVVFVDYERREDQLILTHVETPSALRGQGAAGQLMQGVADLARAQSLKVTPVCSYAAAWFDKHPSYQDLLA